VSTQLVGGQVGSAVRLRRGLKALAFAFALVLTAPLIIVAWVEGALTPSEALFRACGQWLALLPDFPGRSIRGAYYFATLERCSWETHIGFGSVLMHRKAVLCARVSMGAYCVIGHAHLGAGVMMGSRVSIPSGKRQHLDDEGRLASITRFDCVSIGAGSWIGEGAIILAQVGERCIISAGAVVTKEIPDGCLAAGNPARVVREMEADSASTLG